MVAVRGVTWGVQGSSFQGKLGQSFGGTIFGSLCFWGLGWRPAKVQLASTNLVLPVLGGHPHKYLAGR